MAKVTELKLPTGAVLRVQVSTFAVAKNLYQALLREMQAIQVSTQSELVTLFKDLFCVGFSSPAVEAALWACFPVCTYQVPGGGALKIDADTFEPEERRDDYAAVCVEVAKANVLPFAKSLFAEYQRAQSILQENPA